MEDKHFHAKPLSFLWLFDTLFQSGFERNGGVSEGGGFGEEEFREQDSEVCAEGESLGIFLYFSPTVSKCLPRRGC